MSPTGFEPEILVSDQPQNRALDFSITEICFVIYGLIFLILLS